MNQINAGQIPIVAITLGDMNGIGPEITLKSLLDNRIMKYMQPVLIGSESAFRFHAQTLGMTDTTWTTIHDPAEIASKSGTLFLDITPNEFPKVEFGQLTETAGRIAIHAVECAVDLCKDGYVDAMVTAPFAKKAVNMAGYDIPGHTEFIANRTNCDKYTMMLVSSGLMRVGLVTTHISVADVPAQITKENILEKLRIINASLDADCNISRPKIAVLGLNPHSGEGGAFGREEIDIIIPAIQAASDEGILAFGPFPSDGFFGTRSYDKYDAVLAMYHDQGLIPFKTLAFDTGVNFTAGLPIIRTSPDHGTAFDIAGQGIASSESMRSAIYVALDLVRRRKN